MRVCDQMTHANTLQARVHARLQRGVCPGQPAGWWRVWRRVAQRGQLPQQAERVRRLPGVFHIEFCIGSVCVPMTTSVVCMLTANDYQ